MAQKSVKNALANYVKKLGRRVAALEALNKKKPKKNDEEPPDDNDEPDDEPNDEPDDNESDDNEGDEDVDNWP